MTKRQLLKAAAVSLGCLGAVAPGFVSAAGPVTKTTAKAAPAKTLDVALNKSGALRGFVVDAQGKPLDHAKVTVKKGRFEVAKTMTAKDGSFQVADLKNGTYVVEAGQGQGVVRVWAERMAPPAAKPTLVMVSDPTVVRGQVGPASVVIGTLAVGGAVAGTVGVVQSNDAQDDADEANDRANRLQQQVTEQQQRITTLESSN